jgi:hypothetical protein
MKVVTDRHFMWIDQVAKRDTQPHRIDGGAGTYTTAGTTYTEHIELFFIPRFVGTSFKATCRIEGGRWYHSYTLPNDTTAAPGPYRHVTQVLRRIE